MQRQKLIYPATAQTPCRNCRLGDNSSESIPESLRSLSRAAFPGTDDHAAHPFRVSSASQLNRVNDAAPAPPELEPRMPPGCCLVSGERRFRSMALRILQSLSASQVIPTHLVGEQSAGAFETFANTAVIRARVYPFLQATFTPRLMEDQKKLFLRHQPSATPLTQIMGAPNGGCVWLCQLTTPEKERRSKEGGVCT